jgi:hypothetical protein
MKPLLPTNRALGTAGPATPNVLLDAQISEDVVAFGVRVGVANVDWILGYVRVHAYWTFDFGGEVGAGNWDDGGQKLVISSSVGMMK